MAGTATLQEMRLWKWTWTSWSIRPGLMTLSIRYNKKEKKKSSSPLGPLSPSQPRCRLGKKHIGKAKSIMFRSRLSLSRWNGPLKMEINIRRRLISIANRSSVFLGLPHFPSSSSIYIYTTITTTTTTSSSYYCYWNKLSLFIDSRQPRTESELLVERWKPRALVFPFCFRRRVFLMADEYYWQLGAAYSLLYTSPLFKSGALRGCSYRFVYDYYTQRCGRALQ